MFLYLMRFEKELHFMHLRYLNLSEAHSDDHVLIKELYTAHTVPLCAHVSMYRRHKVTVSLSE